ncbi:MAG TPA: SRPBCC domain-containing protein [Nannocystis sp.]|jgi:hypothetical protein
MKEIRTELVIAASAGRVWDILVDFARYPEWNPLTPEATGELHPGSTLRLRVVAGREMRFAPVVQRVEAPYMLRWRGVIGHRLVFSGEHWFSIEPLGPQQVKFMQGEVYSGLLVPLLARTLERDARPAFEAMNRTLQRRAEQTSG